MIYNSAREIEPNISLGTVYRNLKLLNDEGEIVTLETKDKKIHYDGDTSEHSHFICDKCGNIIDLFITFSPLKELEDAGHKVSGEKRLYYGLCKNCK